MLVLEEGNPKSSLDSIVNEEKETLTSKKLRKIILNYLRFKDEGFEDETIYDILEAKLQISIKELIEENRETPSYRNALKDLEEDKKQEEEMEKLILNEEKKWRRKLFAVPPLTKAEERRFIARIRAGDTKARDFFLRANQRLVAKEAMKYAKKLPHLYINFLELIGDGNEGLIEALNRFDVLRDTKFSTFATYWIDNAIKKALETQGRVFRISNTVYFTKVKKVKDVVEQHIQEKYRTPTFEEISSITCLPIEEAIIFYQAAMLPVRYDPHLKEGEGNLVSILESKDFYSQLYGEVKDNLLAILGKVLTVREREVVCKRFGINEPEPMTQQEVADFYRVSHQAVQQVEARAIRKITEAKDEYNLKEILHELTKLKDRIYG